ncbi:hypothetical protein C0J45_22821 [Silurus meridionalis]|nr:hypothetical protein C0J45_22821 [Silurus meridionalis]
MASSNQSAKQYLKDAVENLVGQLKNLPLIFEKLQQRKVFSDNEINQIETETTYYNKTRKILDLVLNKGEEACYQFLRILDHERELVLPNPNSSSQAPDLHTWICLFSFRDEAEDNIQGPISCHQLQHFMKKISSQILAEHWKQSLQFYGENIQENVTFIPLVLDTNTEKNTPYNKFKLKSKKCKKARSKKMKAYIPRDTQGKSPEELLKSREKNILIVGKPGIGKTTVVKQMLHYWAERNDRTLDFMFYIDENTLSNTSAAVTLEELLLSTFFRSNPQMKKNAEEIMQNLQEHSERVTIVFDGINGDFLNNTVFLKIMENELLPEAKIVATCRSDVEYEFPDWPTCTIYVQGFSEESIYDFFNKMTDDPDLVDSVINNPALFSLCHIPMYAFIVAACTLNNTSKEAQTPCTANEMYMWILSHCLKKLQGLGGYNKNYRDMVLSLAESAFNATKLKTINLELDDDENVIAHTFVKTSSDLSPAFDRHFCAFYHNTMQDFFSALWLLEKTEIIDEVLQLCQNEETQHMKYVIPFLCGLHGNRGIVDSWKSIPHLEGLFSLNKVKENTNAFFEMVLNTFFCDQPDDVDIAFICQCLYEFQSSEFCCSFLERIDYCLDFTEEHLDPYTCCTVSYVISNSRNKQVHLNLEKSAVSLSGLKTILKYSQYLRFESKHETEERNKRFRKFTLDLCLQAALHQPQNIWETVQKVTRYYYKEQSDFLLDLYSHVKQYESETGSSVLPALLPVYQSVSFWIINLSERKVSLLQEVLQFQKQKKEVELTDCTGEESEVRNFLQCLPYISQLWFKQFESKHGKGEQEKRLRKFKMDLCLQAALHQTQKNQQTVKKVMTLFEEDGIVKDCEYGDYYIEQSDFLLDLYSHVKQYESKTGSSVLPALLPVYQSVPDVWSINLSERKVSVLEEVLKLQTQKKPVELRDCTCEESEVKSFLQCLRYISELRFESIYEEKGRKKRLSKFKMDLYLQAALHQQQNTQQTVEKVMTLFEEDEMEINDYYKEQSDFSLDLYSHVKQYESKTGSSVLPALLPVYQSVPDVWSINLSKRKVSVFLEVLKLQTEKNPLELRDCTDEESEVRSFLQCLPYISELRFRFYSDSAYIRFLLNLSIAAVDCQSDKGENFTELLASVCSYNTFPFDAESHGFQERQIDFLLDLYSHVKQYESKTGSRVLPALLPVYQSVPDVWSINLSKRKVSLLLEVLKLQTQKKPVELRDCTDEESEVRSFLQCLPYISQLRFYSHSASIRFLLNLSIAAVNCQSDKGENFTELLASVCSYNTFPFDAESHGFQERQIDFLLDLYSHVKQYESKTGRRVLPALLPVYQSVPDVWSINLSEINISLLLEVLKLQTQKKPVVLRNCTDEESEVRSFLQCLPYISQLRFNSDSIQFLLNLSIAAVDCQSDKGENFTELLASVCSYNTFPFDAESHGFQERRSDFLLDLYSHVKQYESKTGSSFLPALLPVYQSGPDVWSIDLSEINISLLLEVLKLQTQKKPVELRDCTDEESEVRSFLQCLPYISQLRLNSDSASIRFLLNLSIAAVDCQSDKGENFTELLASVCSYNTFPFDGESHGFQEEQSDFLLDLYSHVKQYESKTGSRVLPALLPVYQSVPDVWSINLSKRKVSLLLEVLKLQTQKKPVVLRDCTNNESEVRSFLQCLPYISQLRCGENLTACLSKAVVENAEDTELVKAFFAATDSIFIIDWVLSTRECRAVRKVLKHSDSNLKLTLTPRGISQRGLRRLFRLRTHLQKLCLSGRVVQRMVQAFRAVRSGVSVVIDELCMDLNSITPNKTITYLSSLCSLLNIWTVHCVNLSKCRIDAHSLISLMCHPGHLQIRLSKETLQQFTDLLCEVRDGELTRFFLEKTGGDLTSCSLSWEKLIHFLQQRVCRINVNIRKSQIAYNHVRQILPLLSEVQFKRLNPLVLLSVIREIYETRSADCVSGLLSSTHSCINLSNTELDSYHSTALHFTLQHSTSVCLNLLWTSIQEEDLMKILPLFNKVSQLSVDRVLLLKMLHCCSKSDLQKGAATAVFAALKNRLDFSYSTGLDLTTETEDNVLPLSTEDCRDISTAIQNSHQLTELILKDCQIEDAALDLFFPVLHTVRLRCSKPLLLQFLALLRVVNESECVRHVRSLSQALDGDLDLSETPLDLHTYRSLALFLEFTEGLSELDLSHCKLSEHGLELLFPHLHKTAVLDLSHNDIDDNLAGRIYTIVSTSSNIQTVRLFNNRITNKEHFQKDKRFEIW